MRAAVDDQHLIILFDRGGQPFAVGGHVDRFGRITQWNLRDFAALVDVDDAQRIRGLVADVQPLRIGRQRDAARLLADLDCRDDFVGGRIDDRNGGRAFVGYVRKRCGVCGAEESVAENCDQPRRAHVHHLKKRHGLGCLLCPNPWPHQFPLRL